MSTTQVPNQTGFKDDLHRLGQGVDAIKTDIGTLGHGAADAARSGAAELRQGAQHAVEVAKEKVGEAGHAASNGVTSLRGVISKNPLASIGIAVGAGLVLAMFAFRRKH